MRRSGTGDPKDPQAFPYRQLAVLGECNAVYMSCAFVDINSNMSDQRANSLHVNPPIHILHGQVVQHHR